MKLSEKILELRKKHGYSQEELAEKLDVSRQAVSRWEVGSAQPDAVNVLQLSKLFGVTTDYLLHDEYESDRDIPAVKENVEETRRWLRWGIGAGVAALGLMGNLVMYVASRFIEVVVPSITYENGKKWYHWNSGIKGYSFKYFVQEHNLEFLVGLCCALVIAGVAIAFLRRKHVKTAWEKVRSVIKR